jgi:hypothetical protein
MNWRLEADVKAFHRATMSAQVDGLDISHASAANGLNVMFQ